MDTMLTAVTPSGWAFSCPLLRPRQKGRTVTRMTATTHTRRPRPFSHLARLLDVPPVTQDPLIEGMSTDSRRVRPGDVFIAIRGFSADGHSFIEEAVARGARALVLEDPAFTSPAPDRVPAVYVPGSRRAAAILADEWHDRPSEHLTIAGVTGTNGKTTVSLMLESIFSAAGLRTGVIGTLGRRIGDTWHSAERTTPDAIELQELLADMRAAGVSHVAMEVSSHALELDRVYGCRFAAGVFTNLSQDHLDFHSGLDEYLAAKLLLFTEYADMAAPGRPMIAAVNMDDPAGRRIADEARCAVVPYGANGGSRVRARSIDLDAGGVRFELIINGAARPVRLRLTGHFNAYNALAAAACCHGLGLDTEHIVAGLEGLEAVPGRFERVSEGLEYTVIVDYAHTPGALHNVLCAARGLSPARLLCVMGCGGDRDRGKRPMMGKVAGEHCDLTIITSDNPRSEDPLAIIEDIKGGIAGGDYLVEPDRRAAIFEAVKLCRPGDMLIIAGKGHETYQEFADRRLEFDDRVVAREAIRARHG